MNIFALDASSKITSMAFQSIEGRNASFNLDYQYESSSDNISHSEEISLRFNELIAKANFSAKELDVLIVGSGPGSYTGLRISYAFIKGIASSLKLPVAPLSPYLASAYYEFSKDEDLEKLIVTSDARRSQIYLAGFSKNSDFSKEPDIQIVDFNEFKKNVDKEVRHISFSPELFDENTGISSVASKLIYLYANNYHKNEAFSLNLISEIKPVYIRGIQAKTIAERKLENTKKI